MKIVKTRLIKYNDGVVRFDSYTPPVMTGVGGSEKKPTPRDEQTQEQKDENARRSLRRSRKKIRDLILCNFTLDNYRFLTLTYRDNIKDIDVAMNDFGLFMKRLKNHFGNDLIYCGTLERQERGAWHFHILVNKYLPHSKLTKLWTDHSRRMGSVNIQKKNMNNLVHLANYVSKYLTKHLWDFDELLNRKKVLRSKGLNEPNPIDNPTLQQIKKYINIVDKYQDLRDLDHYILFKTDKVVEDVGVFKTVFFQIPQS